MNVMDSESRSAFLGGIGIVRDDLNQIIFGLG